MWLFSQTFLKDSGEQELSNANLPDGNAGNPRSSDDDGSLLRTPTGEPERLECETLPDDPVKRDELIIYIRKSSLQLANNLAIFSVVAHFISFELGNPWVPLDWVGTVILGVYGGNMLGVMVPKNVKDGLLSKVKDLLIKK